MSMIASPGAIVPGQRWVENGTGRTVIILEVNTCHAFHFVAWHYEDEDPGDWHKSLERAFGEWKLFAPEAGQRRESRTSFIKPR